MFDVKFRYNQDVIIDSFETFEEAEECIENLENADKERDEYEPSTYIIVEG